MKEVVLKQPLFLFKILSYKQKNVFLQKLYLMKKNYFVLISLFLFTFFAINSFAQCGNNEAEFHFEINVSSWAFELSWTLQDGNGNLLYEYDVPSGTSDVSISETFCVADDACLVFDIYDTFGDGISCGNCSDDYFLITLNGDTITFRQNYDFDNQDTYQFNCPQGAACFDPLVAVQDVWYDAEFDNSWYEFTPDVSGIYEISTCDSNSCSTQLWFYEDCTGNIFTENEEGAMAYNNNSENCAPQSTLFSILEEGVSYLIRIGDENDDCSGIIKWQVTYSGPVVGCMEEGYCNYDPLASEPGPCYEWNSPDCPSAPDLIMDGPYAANSMFLDQIFMNPNSSYDVCQVEEGCVRGLGERTVLKFATRIANIGDVDYFIGLPGPNPDQFDFDNCHNHAHYKGYAEYILFDEDLNEIPVGFKAGFCVMDIECSGGGTAKYNCGNMGISAGCSDIYGSSTTCNWIDITDVDTGNYTFVIRTNWDQSPDALGRHEADYNNNWAQICLYIGLDGNNNKTFSINSDCPIYTDCLGVELGDAIVDCSGECNGSKLMGDLDENVIQNLADAQAYIQGILGNNLTPSNCNDLNADGAITVFDACLLQDCYYGENDPHVHGADIIHDHCNFPYGYINTGDTMFLSITDYNLIDKYIEISVKNPYNEILAYEFEVSGIELITAENLAPLSEYPISPQNALGGNKVIGISYLDSTLDKNSNYVPLVRLNFNQLTDSTICIAQIIEGVNGRYEATVNVIENGCITISSASEIALNVPETVCDNEGNITLEATPHGGSFFGVGIENNILNLDEVSAGNYPLEYHYPGLSPVSATIEVLNTQVIEMEDTLNVNLSDDIFTLNASPEGGSFIGNAVHNNQFSPELAGLGEHIITYNYPLNNGCTASKEMVINVSTNVSIMDINNILNVQIAPNPFNQNTIISFENDERISHTLEIYDAMGKKVRTYTPTNENFFEVEKENLSNGVYIYKLEGAYISTGRLVVY